MGDPRRLKKKYAKPMHPWQGQRIDEEKALKKKFGLKNKKEIWKANSLLRKFYRQSKRLVPLRTEQAERERTQMLTRLVRLGLLKTNAPLDAVLNITIDDMLNRRLQTVVYKKGFATTINQARQFIIHEHVTVGGRKITVPSYLVAVDEEPLVLFASDSPFANSEHSQRSIVARESREKKERPMRKPIQNRRGRR